jgi:hypothetical protein
MTDDATENPNHGKIIPLARRRRCPICGKPQVHAFRPFCSQRCADQDLGRWLTGSYRIAADEEADVDEDADGGS